MRFTQLLKVQKLTLDTISRICYDEIVRCVTFDDILINKIIQNTNILRRFKQMSSIDPRRERKEAERSAGSGVVRVARPTEGKMYFTVVNAVGEGTPDDPFAGISQYVKTRFPDKRGKPTEKVVLNVLILEAPEDLVAPYGWDGDYSQVTYETLLELAKANNNAPRTVLLELTTPTYNLWLDLVSVQENFETLLTHVNPETGVVQSYEYTTAKGAKKTVTAGRVFMLTRTWDKTKGDKRIGTNYTIHMLDNDTDFYSDNVSRWTAGAQLLPTTETVAELAQVYEVEQLIEFEKEKTKSTSQGSIAERQVAQRNVPKNF